MNHSNEPSIPIRPKETKEIDCMVHGRIEIDLANIKYLKTIRADNYNTAQIHMNSGELYYVRGKDQWELAEDLGIVIGAPVDE